MLPNAEQTDNGCVCVRMRAMKVPCLLLTVITHVKGKHTQQLQYGGYNTDLESVKTL